MTSVGWKAGGLALAGLLLARLVLSAALAAGCDAGVRPLGDCPDDAASYACSAVPADAGGCEGVAPDGAAVFYPMGCVGTFPGCPTPSGGLLTCTCTYNYGFGGLDAETAFVCSN